MRLEHLLSTERQQLLRERSRALGGLLGLQDVPAERVVGGEHHQRHLHVAEDDGQEVVEVVRDAACQASHRLHLLRLAQVLLDPPALAHVDKRSSRTHEPALRVDLCDGGQLDVQDPTAALHELVRHVLDAAGGEEPGQDHVARVRARRLGQELRGTPTDHLFARVAQDLEPAVAHAHEPTVGVDRVQHHGRLVVQRPVLRLALAQKALEPLALGDVLHDRDVEVGRLAAPPQRRHREAHPHERPVLADVALLHRKGRRLAREHPVHECDVGRQIVGVGDGLEVHPLHLLPGVPDQIAVALVHPKVAARGRLQQGHADRRLLEHRAKQGIAFW